MTKRNANRLTSQVGLSTRGHISSRAQSLSKDHRFAFPITRAKASATRDQRTQQATPQTDSPSTHRPIDRPVNQKRRGCVPRPAQDYCAVPAQHYCVQKAHQIGGLAHGLRYASNIKHMTQSIRHQHLTNARRCQGKCRGIPGFCPGAGLAGPAPDWANPPGRRERRRVPRIPGRLKMGTTQGGLAWG